jgi:hypothetical protein
LYPEIRATAECSILGSFFSSEIPMHIKELEIIDSSMDFQRKVSYPPDEPYTRLEGIIL